jgi:hypothetical protein
VITIKILKGEKHTFLNIVRYYRNMAIPTPNITNLGIVVILNHLYRSKSYISNKKAPKFAKTISILWLEVPWVNQHLH